MEELIEHMKFCGWVENDDGSVSHPDCMTFASWLDAIKGCIEVATGV